MDKTKCSVINCSDQGKILGMCSKHYQRNKKHGDPNIDREALHLGRLPDRFWSKVNKNGPTVAHLSTPCWDWQAGTDKHGRGQFSIPGKKVRRAHTVAWFLVKGSWATSSLLHSCDRAICVNPNHLREGTQKENVQDMMDRGRGNHAKGEKSGKSKLTEQEAIEILNSDIPTRVLVKQYPITYNSMRRLRTGETWKHLPRRENALV